MKKNFLYSAAIAAGLASPAHSNPEFIDEHKGAQGWCSMDYRYRHARDNEYEMAKNAGTIFTQPDERPFMQVPRMPFSGAPKVTFDTQNETITVKADTSALHGRIFEMERIHPTPDDIVSVEPNFFDNIVMDYNVKTGIINLNLPEIDGNFKFQMDTPHVDDAKTYTLENGGASIIVQAYQDNDTYVISVNAPEDALVLFVSDRVSVQIFSSQTSSNSNTDFDLMCTSRESPNPLHSQSLQLNFD